MDILVLIFGIIGWIYNYRPLLKATLIISICGFSLNVLSMGIGETVSLCSLLIFIAGIITSLVRMLRQLK